jgi:hypothetical protein
VYAGSPEPDHRTAKESSAVVECVAIVLGLQKQSPVHRRRAEALISAAASKGIPAISGSFAKPTTRPIGSR